MSVLDLAILLTATRFVLVKVTMARNMNTPMRYVTTRTLHILCSKLNAASHSPNSQAQTAPIHAHYQTTTAASRSTTYVSCRD